MQVFSVNQRIANFLSLIVSVIGLAIGVFAFLPLVEAQSESILWSPPMRLSEETNGTPHPTVTVDPWGRIHVLWAYGPEGSGTPNLIYHTYSDGWAWSTPNDVIASHDAGISYTFPYATCDASGRIHLVWAGSDGLYYSSAPALNADYARSWQQPELLVRANSVSNSRIVVDQKGILHIVYNQRLPGMNVMYLSSENHGLSWSLPLAISEIAFSDPQSPDEVQIAIDSQDWLHVVWAESYPPEWVGRHVYYARSTNSGITWTRPEDLSDVSSTEDWDTGINIAIDGQDRLYVVWVCGSGSPGRCTRNSQDEGESWSGIDRLFGDLIGVSGWDTMAVDSHGTVYWIGMLRYPKAIYLSALNYGRWHDPPQPFITMQNWPMLVSAHYPQLAIGQGNKLLLVMNEQDHGPVWFIEGNSSSSTVASPNLPLPTSILTPKSIPTELASTASVVGSQPITQTMESTNSSDAKLDPGVMLLVWALAPVLVLVLVVVLSKAVSIKK